MAFSRFLANILLPWIFKCRPRLPSCFPLILLFSTKLILADFIKLFTSSLILEALGSSVLIIKLLMVTSHFGRILSIWCFNDISFSNISLGASVIALFVPTWIITFCNSSCKKALRFSLILSIFLPRMGWTGMCLAFDSLLSSMQYNMESPTINQTILQRQLNLSLIAQKVEIIYCQCRLQQREENILGDQLVCVGYVSKKKMSMWTSLPVLASGESIKRPCVRVSLCGLPQWKENVTVDKLVSLGHGTDYKTSKPVWATSVKRKCPCGENGLYRPWQKLESVCMDGKACVGYVNKKKMSTWIVWPV